MAFAGKNAVITGGADGIGFEVTKQLLDNDISNIAIIDIQENLEGICKLRNDHPTQIIVFIKMDVANKKGVETAYEEIVKNIGFIDIVVNIAGIFNDLDVKRTIDVNIGGIINSTFAAMEHMSQEKGGRGGIIANMSSVIGLDPLFFMPVYTSTKHAVVGFTRCLANDYYYKRTGIKFIVLCPGATTTQIFKNFTQKIILPDIGNEVNKVLGRLHKQSPADVSRCILEALENEENGKVWVIESKQLHPIKMTRYWSSIEEKV